MAILIVSYCIFFFYVFFDMTGVNGESNFNRLHGG